MKKSSETDWKALSVMDDNEIDYSDIPELPDSFFRRAKAWRPSSKIAVTVELDKDLLEWFKSEGEDWKTRMQIALRLYAETHKAYRHNQSI